MRITGNKTYKPAFCAGKAHVYSDFDGTYCPARHVSLHNPELNRDMPEYCSRMKNLFDTAKDNLHFHITSGRTFGEFDAVFWLLKIRDFRLPLPETYIAKNGSDVYLKTGSDENFYNKGIFPFSYKVTDKQKEKEIKKLTNWDGANIKSFIRNLSNKYCINLIEADTENSVANYGEKSLFSKGKLNSDEWKKLPYETDGGSIKFIAHEEPVADYKIGSRNDGNLKTHLIFSPDYGPCSERNWIYDNFMDELKNYLKENNIKVHINWQAPGENNFYRTCCSITPQIDNKELTKLYDTKKALQKAVKNNDLVIVAGDGSNDFNMLNPLEYLDSDYVEHCKKHSAHREFYIQSMQRRLKDLQAVYNNDNTPYIQSLKKELETNGILNKIQKMPLISIIIKKDKTKLSLISDTFSGTGKVVVVEKGQLDKGIKEAVKIYAQQNETFKQNMSDDFKHLIYNN